MIDRLESLAQTILNYCRKTGAFDADVLIDRFLTSAIMLPYDRSCALSEGEEAGIGIRLISDNKAVWVSRSGLWHNDWPEWIRAAAAKARLTYPDPGNRLWPSAEPVPSDLDIFDAISPEKKSSITEQFLSAARSCFSDPGFRMSVVYEDERHQRVYANSLGIYRSYESMSYALSAEWFARYPGKRFCRTTVRTRRLDTLEDTASLLRRITLQKKAYGEIPSIGKRIDLILTPDAGRIFLKDLFSFFNGDSINNHISPLTDKIARQVSSSAVTLIDQGNMPGGIGTAPFDGEGIPTQRTVLIDRGLLKGFIYDVRAAVHGETTPTGNAFRLYDTLPQVAYSNLFLENGIMTAEKVIRNTSRGLYLTDLWGGGIEAATGQLEYLAAGYVLSGGEIGSPFHNLKIKGNALIWLKQIDAVCNDRTWEHSVCCPTFRISDVRIDRG